MTALERRRAIVNLLTADGKPITGTDLAEKFGVSRQIIVQDIANLREAGHDIMSTHRGYMIYVTPRYERVFKVHHTSEQTEQELSMIVRLGGVVADVYVWHKIYGKIAVNLNIFSHEQIKEFIEGVRSGKSMELMHITSGYHYHTISAESPEILEEIAEALKKSGFIVGGN